MGNIGLFYLFKDKKWGELECFYNYWYIGFFFLYYNKVFWD